VITQHCDLGPLVFVSRSETIQAFAGDGDAVRSHFNFSDPVDNTPESLRHRVVAKPLRSILQTAAETAEGFSEPYLI
jgi:hypothetical protein